SERIPVPAVADEISDLARLLNAMFDRLEASFKNVRRFAADASHELKTPLSLVRLHAEKLLAGGTLNHENEEGMQTLLEELTRVNSTIDELLFLSRAESRSITLELRICRGSIGLHKGRILAETRSNGRALRVVFGIPAQPPPPRAPSLTPDELAPATSR